jgi:hypothetical protein
MKVGDPIEISGFVTKDKYVRGRTLSELERVLGYGAGRLSKGVIVAKPLALPGVNDFETRGYSQVAGHRYRPVSGIDYDVVRRNARDSWSLSGLESLVKFIPIGSGDHYPPGEGVPQWLFTRKVPGSVVAIVTDYPEGRFT